MTEHKYFVAPMCRSKSTGRRNKNKLSFWTNSGDGKIIGICTYNNMEEKLVYSPAGRIHLKVDKVRHLNDIITSTHLITGKFPSVPIYAHNGTGEFTVLPFTKDKNRINVLVGHTEPDAFLPDHFPDYLIFQFDLN